MASPDLDFCELHLSIKDYATGKPFVASSGLTSLDLPYESIEIDDKMYEPNTSDLSTAHVVLPSLMAFPELRPLLQQIKIGSRVELYNFQPDCGRPVFAGHIPANGLTEQDGHLTLDVLDPLVQGQWQRVRRQELYNDPVSSLYDRALKRYADLVNEDFSNPTAVKNAYFTGTNHGGATTPLQIHTGWLEAPSGVTLTSYFMPNTNPLTAPPGLGDIFLFEADVTCGFQPMSVSSLDNPSAFLGLVNPDMNTAGLTTSIDSKIGFGSGFGSVGPLYSIGTRGLGSNTGGASVTNGVIGSTSFHMSFWLRFVTGAVSVALFQDNVPIYQQQLPWNYPNKVLTPYVGLFTSAAAQSDVKIRNWRASRLAPYLQKAGRFNPQTSEAIYYQPNQEDLLAFLRYFVGLDNAEYRVRYNPAPQLDELELDAVGTLGSDASATLTYDQPGASPAIDASSAAPFAVDADPSYGAYVVAPPFRFEEGKNLVGAPKSQPKAAPYANDIIRAGSAALDSQVFGEAWSVADVGNPVLGVAGSYPRIESLANDDRSGQTFVAEALAQNDLAIAIATTPALEFDIVDEVHTAQRWRAGDSVYVITRSLLSNVEQEMRVMQVKHTAGSPRRTVTMGRLVNDPDLQSRLARAMYNQWLYEQSGAGPLTFVFPSPGSLLAAASTATFNFGLDQFTTGPAIVSAKMHWFSDGSGGVDVLSLQPVINGSGITPASPEVSSTDSGTQDVTPYFQVPGQYQWSFTNNGAATTVLLSAYLVIRIRL